MKSKEYKRNDLRKPVSTDNIKGSKILRHTIDREIDNESIWFIEVNKDKKMRMPVTLDVWERMKSKSKEELHAVVLLRFVNKSGRNVEHYN